MAPLSLAERDHYEQLWRNTLWERLDGDCWLPLPSSSAVACVVISAWNPCGRSIPLEVNRARDRILHGELAALGLSPIRARGRSPDGHWSEEGWQIVHEATRSSVLLCRYGQIAGWVTGPDGPSYHWATSLLLAK